MNYLKLLRHIPAKLYNPETADYRDRVIAAGGTLSEASLDAVEKFVRDCKNNELWDKLLEVAPFAGSNLSAALVKLIHPAGVSGTITNVNFVSGDYAETGPNGGLLGDGATKYLNTGFNLASFLPDNSHLSFYLREDVSASANRSLLGGLSSTEQYWLGALTNTQRNVRLGQTATATQTANMTKGFYAGSRTGGSSLKLYKDGLVIATDSASVTHTKPSVSLYAFAFSSSGSASAYLPGRGSFYSIGHGLTEIETLLLHDAVRTLQRNLGRDIN